MIFVRCFRYTKPPSVCFIKKYSLIDLLPFTLVEKRWSLREKGKVERRKEWRLHHLCTEVRMWWFETNLICKYTVLGVAFHCLAKAKCLESLEEGSREVVSWQEENWDLGSIGYGQDSLWRVLVFHQHWHQFHLGRKRKHHWPFLSDFE